MYLLQRPRFTLIKLIAITRLLSHPPSPSPHPRRFDPAQTLCSFQPRSPLSIRCNVNFARFRRNVSSFPRQLKICFVALFETTLSKCAIIDNNQVSYVRGGASVPCSIRFREKKDGKRGFFKVMCYLNFIHCSTNFHQSSLFHA